MSLSPAGRPRTASELLVVLLKAPELNASIAEWLRLSPQEIVDEGGVIDVKRSTYLGDIQPPQLADNEELTAIQELGTIQTMCRTLSMLSLGLVLSGGSSIIPANASS